jgi:hypothetical protein
MSKAGWAAALACRVSVYLVAEGVLHGLVAWLAGCLERGEEEGETVRQLYPTLWNTLRHDPV